MNINICNHDCTELWNQVLYKKLSHYPDISDWEMKNILDFITYENNHNREVEILSDQDAIVQKVKMASEEMERFATTIRPEMITECTACPVRKGCMTKFVCHTASLENAKKIFESGKLLSAVNARKLPDFVLAAEPRNAAHDPEDFFIM